VNHNDLSQSNDTLNALRIWYDDFKEFKNNSLYVSGESYGGVYVPYLAWRIHGWNLRNKIYSNTSADDIPLKGFAVGNGCTNWDVDTEPAILPTLHGFDMIGQPLY
jgi:carboxypeptidase C (cathepsin A)